MGQQGYPILRSPRTRLQYIADYVGGEMMEEFCFRPTVIGTENIFALWKQTDQTDDFVPRIGDLEVASKIKQLDWCKAPLKEEVTNGKDLL